ncbi:MAG: ferredoxin [Planctomycetota bacterium]|jgi:ferredoxin
MADTVTSVTIIADECISCEACVAVAPDVLEMEDDITVVKADANNPDTLAAQSEAIIQAAEECPTEAIKYETA